MLDPDLSNNVRQIRHTVEVFEEVDLEADVTQLTCSEREANPTSSTCTATVTVTNNGPATAVQTLTDVSFTVEDSCTVTPINLQTTPLTLDADESVTLTVPMSMTCTAGLRHTVGVSATIRNAPSDPHAVDSDTDTLTWVPSDAKPRSLPSAVNVGKEGLVPFAILATAGFDPLTEVDVTTLTYGVTGAEDSHVACKTEGEDVNGDGLLDLICHAETQLTGVSCTSTHFAVNGVLVSGEPFVGQDDIKVVGCRR